MFYHTTTTVYNPSKYFAASIIILLSMGIANTDEMIG